MTITSSLPDIGKLPSESTTVPLVSVNAPGSEPVFLMSTVPLVAGSAGFMFEAVRIAALFFELTMVIVPARERVARVGRLRGEAGA